MGQATGMEASASHQGQTGSEQGSSATEQVRDKAQETTTQVRGQVSSQVDQRSTEAGERLRSMAGDAHTVGDELRKQGKDQPARMADQAADRVERIGSYLQESDGERILRDVEDFGRRQPALLVAGDLAIGFLASRFLKASSGERRSRVETASGQQLGRGHGTRPSDFAAHR